MEQNLTEGSVWKSIASFSLPYLLSYFLQTLYGMADLFIIGQFEGAAGTTAVSVGSQVMHLITVMIVGLAMGSTVLIGQAVGAGNQEKASRTIGNAVVLFALAAVVSTGLLLRLVRPVTAVMSTPEEAVAGTVSYLTVCFLGIPCITAYNVISSIFRGLGDSKSPMYFIAVACVTNIALDYLFIGGLRLGPMGAALGTTLSQAVSVAVSLWVICRRDTGISLKKADFRMEAPVLKQVLRIGIPVALQDGLIQVAFLVITVIANRRGLCDAAAVGIVEKVISFLFLVPSSMLSTVSVLCAQSIGANRHDRTAEILRDAICITMTFGIAAAAVVQIAAQPIVGLFTTDAAVVTAGGQYLRGYIFDCVFAGIHFCFSGYFCAYGKSELSFLHNVASILLVRVPGAYWTANAFPETLLPMGLATAAGSLLSTVICVTAFCILRKRGAFGAGASKRNPTEAL